MLDSPSEGNISVFYSQYFFHDVDFTPPFHGTNTRKDEFSSVREDACSSSFNVMTGKQIFHELYTEAGEFLRTIVSAELSN